MRSIQRRDNAECRRLSEAALAVAAAASSERGIALAVRNVAPQPRRAWRWLCVAATWGSVFLLGRHMAPW
jgi:hypothetical protein